MIRQKIFPKGQNKQETTWYNAPYLWQTKKYVNYPESFKYIQGINLKVIKNRDFFFLLKILISLKFQGILL